ncbi:B-cell lymphoma 3 protein-like isoform X2 [Saccoglossus kowalevskii]|uniref:Ankyrin repeat domain-containing protein 17-like n=1 Tax=Saccoglossus kowalevskii TaxID=10224 RepID=A0ABM0M4X2_SACKO|nr:PREDICTED: ankyrin repeat domain-containing protein 17-like [Saccoglossus kowalevskii]
MVKTCLNQGADLYARRTDNASVLHSACTGIHDDVLTFLLEKGLKIEDKDKNSYTPLHYATYHGKNIEVVNVLLRNNCNIEAKSSDGETALFLASWKGNADIVRLLIQSGANLGVTAEGKSCVDIALE